MPGEVRTTDEASGTGSPFERIRTALVANIARTHPTIGAGGRTIWNRWAAPAMTLAGPAGPAITGNAGGMAHPTIGAGFDAANGAPDRRTRGFGSRCAVPPWGQSTGVVTLMRKDMDPRGLTKSQK